MDYPLAVLTPRIGVRSETFVRRHALDLLPGKTVLVSREVPKAASGDWCVTSPVLCLSPNGPLKRFLRRLPNSTGWSAARNQRRVKAFLKDNRVKVILGEYLDFSYPFMATAVEFGVQFYAHGHGCDGYACLREEVWQKRYLAYNNAAGVIVVSRHSGSRLT